jgi:hypothetical protein
MSENSRKIYWRCFHCGDAFTRAQEKHAREHFGANHNDEPVCLIRSAGEAALLSALRNAQAQLESYRCEDSDLMRVLWSMQADHAVALRREEEKGYARGMADMRKELTP